MSTLKGSILESFRRRGLRCTAQRYAVMEHLLRYPTHPTAEEIFRAVNQADPRASLATVYKALHTLAEAGLVRELYLGGGANRFEAVAEKHHHFVCNKCGKVEDIPWLEIPASALRRALEGRQTQAIEVVVRGFCTSCASTVREARGLRKHFSDELDRS